jgi:hypothetical protein
MFVPNRARRSVVFIGDLTDRGVFRPRGTAFFVGVPSTKHGLGFAYLVTAQHVVVMLQERQNQIYYRLNRKDGSASVEPLQVPKWWFHPDSESEQTDVAVAAIPVNWDIVDHETIPMPEKWEPNPLQLGRREVGLGTRHLALGSFACIAGPNATFPLFGLAT